MKQASGFQIAQARPADTSAATAYTASIRTEITLIVVANTTGTSATYSIYHDDDGTTFDAATALFHEVSISANATEVIALDVGGGLMITAGGSIGIKSGTASAITYTLYGHTSELRIPNV